MTEKMKEKEYKKKLDLCKLASCAGDKREREERRGRGSEEMI